MPFEREDYETTKICSNFYFFYFFTMGLERGISRVRCSRKIIPPLGEVQTPLRRSKCSFVFRCFIIPPPSIIINAVNMYARVLVSKTRSIAYNRNRMFSRTSLGRKFNEVRAVFCKIFWLRNEWFIRSYPLLIKPDEYLNQISFRLYVLGCNFDFSIFILYYQSYS